MHKMDIKPNKKIPTSERVRTHDLNVAKNQDPLFRLKIFKKTFDKIILNPNFVI